MAAADCDPDLSFARRRAVVEDVLNQSDLSVPVLPLEVWPVGAESSGAGSEELLLLACCKWLPKDELLGPAARKFATSVTVATEVWSIAAVAAVVIEAVLTGAVLIGTMVTRVAGIRVDRRSQFGGWPAVQPANSRV